MIYQICSQGVIKSDKIKNNKINRKIKNNPYFCYKGSGLLNILSIIRMGIKTVLN